jgi:hypothetical protein
MVGWDIVRTKPIAKTYGYAIPVFIHNVDYHLARVGAYADGAIECWGFVDRELFRKKITSGWIATQPPIGERISIFNLGCAIVGDAQWLISPQDILKQVEEAIQRLNPALLGLIDMQGNDSEIRNGLCYAKLGLADEKSYRLDEQGQEILGKELPIFAKIEEEYHLTHWFIYADGKTRLGYDRQLLTIDEVSQQFEDGLVTTSVPDNQPINIPGLGQCHMLNGAWYVEPEERIREAKDELAVLNGSLGSIRLCIRAHEFYEETSTEDNREKLRVAYEAVPKHLRMYCGDMDSKDWPIRRILYGNQQ